MFSHPVSRVLAARTGRTIRLLTAAVAAALITVAGCDSDSGKADKQVDQAISQAAPKYHGGANDQPDVQKLLGDASANKDASLPQQIRAKALMAQYELREAQKLEPQITATDLRIQQIVWHANLLAGQVAGCNQSAAALAKLEPVKEKSELAHHASAVQGSEQNPAWITTETPSGQATVSAASTAAAEATKLQAVLTDLQGQLKQATEKRSALLAQADNLNRQSEQEAGQKSVDMYCQGADLRKQAADLSVLSDQLNLKLGRTQADLAIVQGQQTVLQDTAAVFADHSKRQDQKWAEIKKSIDQQKQLAQALLGSDSDKAEDKDNSGGSTISSKLATISDLVAANRKVRDDAIQHLRNAIKLFGDARSTAETLRQDLESRIKSPENTSRPEVKAWSALEATLHPAKFQLDQAGAQVYLAQLCTGQANVAAARQGLSDALKNAVGSMTLPSAANDAKITEDLNLGRQEADLRYKAANETLGNVIDGAAPEPQKQSAQVAKIFAEYGWGLLARSADDATASDHIKEAMLARDTAMQNNTPLPVLPPELAKPASTPTPAPTPTPTPTPETPAPATPPTP